MGYILATILVIVIIIRILSKKRTNHDHAELLEELRDDPFPYQDYVSGFPGLKHGFGYRIVIEEEKLLFISSKGDIEGKLPLDKIRRAELTDFSTYDSGRSLAQVFFFGLWSWLFFKDKVDYQYRLQIYWLDEMEVNSLNFDYFGSSAEIRSKHAYQVLQEKLAEHKTLR